MAKTPLVAIPRSRTFYYNCGYTTIVLAIIEKNGGKRGVEYKLSMHKFYLFGSKFH